MKEVYSQGVDTLSLINKHYGKNCCAIALSFLFRVRERVPSGLQRWNERQGGSVIVFGQRHWFKRCLRNIAFERIESRPIEIVQVLLHCTQHTLTHTETRASTRRFIKIAAAVASAAVEQFTINI